MDDKKNNKVDEKNYITVLKEAQSKIPNIILPSMGLIDNTKKIEINGKDYLNSIKEDQDVK